MLGLVLTPYGRIPGALPFQILGSGPDNGSHLKPYDPYYQQRGEAGFYHDTALGRGQMGPVSGLQIAARNPLGALPTDAEMGRYTGYTPVQSGWIRTTTGYMAPPWTPGYGPGPGLGAGAGGYLPGTVPLPAELLPSGDATFNAEEAHRNRMFWLSVISTSAVVAVSLFNIVRGLRAKAV